MSERTVHCKKLGKNLPGFVAPPYPGGLGTRIYEQISKQAWDEWINQMTKLINEQGLSPAEQKDQEYLEQAMERFLFSDSAPA
jgi:Fe-S cluster biosynthesis and repair protein YggX